MPPKKDLESRVLREIVTHFAKTRRGLSRRNLVVLFRSKELPSLLGRLVEDGLLFQEDTDSRDYVPSIAAFDVAQQRATLIKARTGFLALGEALTVHFLKTSDRTPLPVATLFQDAKARNKSVDDTGLFLGLYALREFGFLNGYTINPTTKEIDAVFTAERLFLADDLLGDWYREIKSRVSRHKMSSQEVLPRKAQAVAVPLKTNVETWEKVSPLGSGGQSDVWLVRSPARQMEIRERVQEIVTYYNRGPESAKHTVDFASAVKAISRDELPHDLGALKEFKIPPGAEGELAVARLRRELQVLSGARPGLLKLLGSSETERWIVTEYFSKGSLERQITHFKAKPIEALISIRGLTETLLNLHKEKIVHRDIKPANVFLKDDGSLILGDFGIVYLPDEAARVTHTDERVGPRDYMPPWAPISERQGDVLPDFDVYMLGKLLWCMVAGRLRLFREYHKRPEFNLEKLFPGDSNMTFINRVLDESVTEDQRRCPEDAGAFLRLIDQVLPLMQKGAYSLSQPMDCRVCGKGIYMPRPGINFGNDFIVPYACNVCWNFQLFANGYPQGALESIASESKA